MDGEIPLNLHTFRDSDPDGFARLIGQLRDAASACVESTSLRQAAREIGMSPTGLGNFISGTEPYLTTVRKLRDWYERTRNAQTAQLEAAAGAENGP